MVYVCTASLSIVCVKLCMCTRTNVLVHEQMCATVCNPRRACAACNCALITIGAHAQRGLQQLFVCSLVPRPSPSSAPRVRTARRSLLLVWSLTVALTFFFPGKYLPMQQFNKRRDAQYVWLETTMTYEVDSNYQNKK